MFVLQIFHFVVDPTFKGVDSKRKVLAHNINKKASRTKNKY